MQKLGVGEIKQLATGGAKIGTGFGRIMEDGQVNLRDTVHIPQVLGGLHEFVGVDYSQLLPEIKDIDEAERKELADHFQSVFDLPNDSIETIVEQGLDICLMLIQAVVAFRSVSLKVKAPTVA